MSTNNENVSSKREVNWFCVVFNLQFLISCCCGLHAIIYEAYLLTTFFNIFLITLILLGVTAGSHRLWAHHSYKASTPLKLFLMFCQTLGGNVRIFLSTISSSENHQNQGTIYYWVRLHRLHHKYYQTELDPFCPQKGFFYSHFICSNLKLNAEQEKGLEEIDMSDLESDRVVMFQKKYYWLLFLILTLLLPLNAPVEYWDETILNSVFIIGWIRLGITYHLALLIHTGINIFDFNNTDKNSFDSNWVFFITKSYWISYHYLNPQDYQTSEYGKYGTDCTSKFIRVCAALELATGLKTVDSNIVREALALSIEKEKPISECLSALQSSNVLKNHYLTPSKFY